MMKHCSVIQLTRTERCGRVINTRVSYSGGPVLYVGSETGYPDRGF
jgi:hypothetical protein